MLRYCFLLSTLIFASPLLSLNWMSDFQKATDEAKRQNKPLLVYFSSAGSVWCERLDTSFLKKPEFDSIGDEMIVLKLDYPRDTIAYSDMQKELKKTYKVFNFPTLVILSSSGKSLGSVGYPRDTLAEYMAKIRDIAQIKMVEAKSKEEMPKTVNTSNSNKTTLKQP